MSFSQRFKALDSKWYLVPKILFFTMNLAYYSCYAFRAKYLKETQGIETKDYAVIAALLSLILFFGGYFWSYLADRTGGFRSILLISTIASAAVFQAFLFPFPANALKTLVAVVSGSYIFFVSAMLPLLDSLCMTLLSHYPGATKALYGRQRLWGTVAYAVVSSGISLSKKLNPIVNICVVVFSGVFAVTVVAFLPANLKKPEDKKDVEAAPPKEKSDVSITKPELAKAKSGENIKLSDAKVTDTAATAEPVKTRHPLLVLLSNGNFLFLLLIVFMNGFARAMMTHFLEPIQRNVFKSPQWVSGLACPDGVALEVVIFFYSQQLLAKLGPRYMLLLAQTAMVVRISCYAFIPRDFEAAKYITLVYELLKGVNFGLMQSAAVTWVTEMAPKEVKSTAQSVYTGVFAGLAAFVSGMIGYAIQNINSQYNFGPKPTDAQKALIIAEEVERSVLLLKITAYVSMVALKVFIIKYIIIDGMREKRQMKKQLANMNAGGK